VIDCDGLRVELAHLREGSLRVAPGQSLAAGDLIGAVGNSGNTTEPHLHVHAVDAHGAGVPIAFDGRAPVRNLLYRR
jgi:murein DD-endopeptidase MepM/ murein hydrolase activator NlpD